MNTRRVFLMILLAMPGRIFGAETTVIGFHASILRVAEQTMLRASREWLALDRRDEKARDAYLERWVYGELGIERKIS
jgi:hypothetical protein